MNLEDPTLLATARRVQCVVADRNEWAAVDKGAGIEVELRDGRRLREIVPYSKGLPENPMSEAEVKEKFASLVDPILPRGRGRQIIDAVDRIEALADIDELAQLLVVPAENRVKGAA